MKGKGRGGIEMRGEVSKQVQLSRIHATLTSLPCGRPPTLVVGGCRAAALTGVLHTAACCDVLQGISLSIVGCKDEVIGEGCSNAVFSILSWVEAQCGGGTVFRHPS